MRVRVTPASFIFLTSCAIIGSGIAIVSRAMHCRERSVWHGAMATLGVRLSPTGQPVAFLSAEELRYHARMERKYRAAAANPFRSILPDRPEP
jgi:hypothetical protein